MRNVRSLSLLALAALGVACSGGSVNPGGPSLPRQTAAPAPASGHRAEVTLKLTIPARSKSASVSRGGARRPAYISPATLGAILTATSTTGITADDESYGYNLSTSGVCTGDSPIVCTLSFPLFADTYSITVKAYDANEDGVSPGAGSPSAPAGNELSVDTETETVVLGADNFFTNFLLHAVVNAFTVLGSTNFGATGGTPFPSPLPTAQFAALDADSFNVDAHGNATTYANGPFTASVTQMGDTAGCATTPATRSRQPRPSTKRRTSFSRSRIPAAGGRAAAWSRGHPKRRRAASRRTREASSSRARTDPARRRFFRSFRIRSR